MLSSHDVWVDDFSLFHGPSLCSVSFPLGEGRCRISQWVLISLCKNMYKCKDGQMLIFTHQYIFGTNSLKHTCWRCGSLLAVAAFASTTTAAALKQKNKGLRLNVLQLSLHVSVLFSVFMKYVSTSTNQLSGTGFTECCGYCALMYEKLPLPLQQPQVVLLLM